MIVELATLGEEAQEFKGEEPSEVFDLGSTEDVRSSGPLKYRLSVSLAGDELVARGVVRADFLFLCGRCAEFFVLTVADSRFMAVLECPNKNESVDLTPEMRESIILAFPTSPLCNSDCRGLCPLCGTNLNKSECKCGPSSSGGQWDVLKNLKLE